MGRHSSPASDAGPTGTNMLHDVYAALVKEYRFFTDATADLAGRK